MHLKNKYAFVKVEIMKSKTKETITFELRRADFRKIEKIKAVYSNLLKLKAAAKTAGFINVEVICKISDEASLSPTHTYTLLFSFLNRALSLALSLSLRLSLDLSTSLNLFLDLSTSRPLSTSFSLPCHTHTHTHTPHTPQHIHNRTARGQRVGAQRVDKHGMHTQIHILNFPSKVYMCRCYILITAKIIDGYTRWKAYSSATWRTWSN
jgi:hypothetical protein